ncbi:hypothetical protein T484DRAFT_1758478, partial [Baffinella frigidus]
MTGTDTTPAPIPRDVSALVTPARPPPDTTASPTTAGSVMSVSTSIDALRSRRRPDDVSAIDTMTTLPSAQETDEATAARFHTTEQTMYTLSPAAPAPPTPMALTEDSVTEHVADPVANHVEDSYEDDSDMSGLSSEDDEEELPAPVPVKKAKAK